MEVAVWQGACKPAAFLVSAHIVILDEVDAREQIELTRVETFFVNHRLGRLEEVHVVLAEGVLVQGDAGGGCNRLVDVEPVRVSDLLVLLMSE